MAKFAFIVACESNKNDDDEDGESVKSNLTDTLKSVTGLSKWVISELVPVADSVAVEEVATWL